MALKILEFEIKLTSDLLNIKMILAFLYKNIFLISGFCLPYMCLLHILLQVVISTKLYCFLPSEKLKPSRETGYTMKNKAI